MTTTNRDFDRIARAWLDLMPDEAPDRVIDAVVKAAEATPQVRPHFGRVTRRFRDMPRFALVGVSAAVAAVIAGLALLNLRPTANVGTATPTAGASPSTIPTGTWTAPKDGISFYTPSGATSELLAIVSTGNGDHLFVREQGFPVDRTAFLSSITAASDSEVVLRVTSVAPLGGRGFGSGTPVSVDGVAFAGCKLGDLARYRWVLAADGNSMTLFSLGDACPSREVVLARLWTRNPSTPTPSP